MPDWDRIQRLEMELAQCRRTSDVLAGLVEEQRAAMDRLLEERDSARALAVRLEQEVAECEADIHTLHTALAGLPEED